MKDRLEAIKAAGEDGYVVTEGSQVLLGGNDCYVAMCHKCWKNAIKNHLKVEKI